MDHVFYLYFNPLLLVPMILLGITQSWHQRLWNLLQQEYLLHLLLSLYERLLLKPRQSVEQTHEGVPHVSILHLIIVDLKLDFGVCTFLWHLLVLFMYHLK